MFQTVQAARAFASIAVVLFHAGGLVAAPKYGGHTVLGGWTQVGDLGVDFFFLISGFVICHAHCADIGMPAQLPRYAWRRFSRIYPIYWVFATILFGAVMAGASAGAPAMTPLDILTSYSLVRFTSTTTSVATAWSLFNEVFFYAVFAILIANRLLGLIVMAAWAAAIVLTLHVAVSGYTFLGVIINPMNLNFFLGIAVYLALSRVPLRFGPTLLGLSVGLLAVCEFALDGDLRFDGRLYRLLYGVPFAGVLLGLLLCERRGLSVPKWLSFLGDASYTIYLTHFALLSLLAKSYDAIGLSRLMPPLAYWASLCALSVWGGCVLYLAVEKPLLRRVRRWGYRMDVRPGNSKAPAAIL